MNTNSPHLSIPGSAATDNGAFSHASGESYTPSSGRLELTVVIDGSISTPGMLHSPWIQPTEDAILSPTEGADDDDESALVTSPNLSSTLRHPPTAAEVDGDSLQPSLLRTSQIPGSKTQLTPFSLGRANKALLKFEGDLNAMAMGWSADEWQVRRRLVQFWRSQEGNIINARFAPIRLHDFSPDHIVISCIFRDDKNECFVTSVDAIYLLEALIAVRFTVEEKNRIRRNLEGFKPITVSKAKSDSEPFFKLIMGFPNPKPRNIEKDVKVFPWKILANALIKIISKVSKLICS